jgi:glycosyltransferase 2 family protein
VSVTGRRVQPQTDVLKRPLSAAARSIAGWALVLLVAMLIGFAFLRDQAAPAIGALQDVQGAVLLGVLGLSIMNFVLRGLRWNLASRWLGLDVPWPHSLAVFLAGFSMGVTPGRVGEAVRLALLKSRHGLAYRRTLPLMLNDRVTDVCAVVLLVTLAGVITRSTGQTIVVAVLLVLLLAAVTFRYPRVFYKAASLLHRATGRFGRGLAFLRRSLRNGRVLYTPGRLALGTLLGLLAWLAESVGFFVLLHALGEPLPLWSATYIYAFATLVGALTFMPGGLGGFEATSIFLLHRAGVDLGTATVATGTIRLATLWFSVALGAGVLSFVVSQAKVHPA